MSCSKRAVSVCGGKRITERSRSGSRGGKEVEVRKYTLLLLPASSSFRRAVGAENAVCCVIASSGHPAYTEGSIRAAEIESRAG